MNSVTVPRFPRVDHLRLGLGVGFDLPWDGARGFGARAGGGDGLAKATRTFLERESPRWSHAFFSFQPRDRGRLRLADYAPAWDDLFSALPPELPRALHHTALNLGALGPYPRGEILDFTNAFCERYAIQWVNEDVGLWSLAGRPVPYPLPPLLTPFGLEAAIENVRECQSALAVPLLLEFPGFARGVSLVMGELDAYDFFRVLAEDTRSPVTLDVGHLLSWRWWRGLRGEALFGDLDRLPLANCFELHLSGCEIADGRFVDAHHGRLLDEQFTLLDRLLPLCPNARAVTFEDPRLDDDGALAADNLPSWQRLVEVMDPWTRARAA